MSYEAKRAGFNWTIILGFVAVGLLLTVLGMVSTGRVDGESAWKRARRLEAELSQAVAESEAFGAALADADSRLTEVEGALGDATERVGELEADNSRLAADNLRALAIVGNITTLSIGLASGSGDIERLSSELAAEIDIALDTVRRLQEGVSTDND